MQEATKPITVQELQEISGLDVLYFKQWCEGFFRWMTLGLAGIQEWDDDFDEDQIAIPKSFSEIGGRDSQILAYLQKYSRNEDFTRI